MKLMISHEMKYALTSDSLFIIIDLQLFNTKLRTHTINQNQ